MSETLRKMHEVIDSHLDETTNTEARAENPSNRDQELLIATLAMRIEALLRTVILKETKSFWLKNTYQNLRVKMFLKV